MHIPIYRVLHLTRKCIMCNAFNNIATFPKHEQGYLVTRRLKNTKVLKNEKEKMRTFLVQKYVDYVNSYTAVLEKRFPTAVKMYRVFSIGLRDFLTDLKTYISLRMKVTKDQGLSKMTRQEIELYFKMPTDMYRIAPVLILTAIPFGNYIIFPLALLRPRQLLCSHFWSIQQRTEFSIQDLKERLKNNRSVYRALQSKLDTIEDGDMKIKWTRVIALLGSGVHPKVEDILECNTLFINGPYVLENLSYSHMGYLLKMHGLRKNIFRRKMLRRQAFLLTEMDKAINREGGVESLNTASLRNACHLRGLNGTHLTNHDMREWLRQWLIVSENTDKNSYSLLLHGPIFLAYNHPQNWMLIY